MTSNAGAKAIVDPKKLGFVTKEDAAGDYKKMKANVMDEVKLLFRPEFLNRIDEIIVFHSLTIDHMKNDCWIDVQRIDQTCEEPDEYHIDDSRFCKKIILWKRAMTRNMVQDRCGVQCRRSWKISLPRQY